jgi:hypothetical protein
MNQDGLVKAGDTTTALPERATDGMLIGGLAPRASSCWPRPYRTC